MWMRQAADQEMWRLAVSIVHSRGMSLECGIHADGSVREPFVVVPFADFLNHTPAWPTPFTWDWRGDEGEGGDGGGGGAVCVWATTDVAAGEEALISYGDERSNDSLMTYYGFVLPDNPYETAQVSEPFLYHTRHPSAR